MGKYINKLTNEDISIFLENNGYQLVKDLKDNEGNAINAIERSPNNILVRAKRINDETLDFAKYYATHKTAIIFSALKMNDTNTQLIFISDYDLSMFCIFPKDQQISEELCNSYIQYMSNKFPNYKKDLENNYAQLNNER